MKKNLTTEIPHSKISNSYLPWILFILSFFIYSNSLNNGYNMDDNLVRMNHPITSKGLSSFQEIFTTPYYTDEYGNNYGYRPVSQLSFAIEHTFFGENVKISHLINLLIYSLGTVLLYQLLSLLFDETKRFYIFFACVLFAIHPIHTEVVNSIKNRDELLSFTFALLASKYFIHSLKDEKILKLILSFIFILLAVLSKKSIYPIILIIPGILALTQSHSLKKLLIYTFIITIPVAVFSSEMQVTRMIILTLFPLISVTILYYTNQIQLSTITSNLSQSIAAIICIVLCVLCYSTLSLHFSFLFLTIPLFIWLFKTDEVKGLWLLPFILFYIGYANNEFWIGLIGALIPLGYYMYQYFNNTLKNHYLLIYSIVLILSSTLIYREFVSLIISANFLLFSWIFIKKSKYAIAYIIFVLVCFSITDYYSKEPITEILFIKYTYPLILLTLILIRNQYHRTNNIQWIKIIPSICLFLILGASTIQYSLENQEPQSVDQPVRLATPKPTSIQTNQHSENKNIFREGRMLTLIENPLIAPHSSTETIATGLYALGHYARLLIYPKELSFYYGYSKIDIQNFSSIWVWLSLIFYLGLLFLILYYFNTNKMISIGFGWYITCILLFSNWVELVAGVVGERLAFLASVGFFIGVCGLLYEVNILNFNKSKALKISAIVTTILLLSTRTWNRNYNWKDSYTLMNNDIVHLKNSAQANYLYANSVMRVGMSDQTLTPEQRNIFFQAGVNHFKKAVAIDSTFLNAQYDLARSYMYIKDTANAINTFETCNRLVPNNPDILSKLNFLKERFH